MMQIKRLLTEFVGTMVLVTMAVSAIIMHAGTGGQLGLIGIGLVTGLTLGILVYAYGHISGGHFNPAVTIGMALVRRFPMNQVIPYVVAQLLGSIAAIGLIKYGLKGIQGMQSLGDMQMGLEPVQSFGIEVFITFVFMSVIIAVTTDKRAQGSAGLPIGLVLAILTMVAVPLSGAALNPARAFGPAVWTGNWDIQWIYWVGPIVGATLGAVLYDFIRDAEAPKHKA